MTTPENSRSRPGGADSRFCKKLGGLLFSAKVQNHPGSSEIGRNLHKIQKIPLKAAATK
jgi:hypothetical protein